MFSRWTQLEDEPCSIEFKAVGDRVVPAAFLVAYNGWMQRIARIEAAPRMREGNLL